MYYYCLRHLPPAPYCGHGVGETVQYDHHARRYAQQAGIARRFISISQAERRRIPFISNVLTSVVLYIS